MALKCLPVSPLQLCVHLWKAAFYFMKASIIPVWFLCYNTSFWLECHTAGARREASGTLLLSSALICTSPAIRHKPYRSDLARRTIIKQWNYHHHAVATLVNSHCGLRYQTHKYIRHGYKRAIMCLSNTTMAFKSEVTCSYLKITYFAIVMSLTCLLSFWQQMCPTRERLVVSDLLPLTQCLCLFLSSHT